jgi:hypothetical protein
MYLGRRNFLGSLVPNFSGLVIGFIHAKILLNAYVKRDAEGFGSLIKKVGVL